MKTLAQMKTFELSTKFELVGPFVSIAWSEWTG